MSSTDFPSVYFPYCLLQQSDGRYVVLNREYKPLGFKTSKHVNYEEYPILVEFKGLTKTVATQLSCDGSDIMTQIFLYNDGSVPTRSAEHLRSYMKKLRLLAKLDIVEDGA